MTQRGKIILCISVMVTVVSCRSVPHWDYRQEGNRARLSLPLPFSAVVEGEVYSEGKGSSLFYMDRMYIFYNWQEGWTDSVMTMEGVLRFYGEPTETLHYEIMEMPRILQVSESQIRLKRERYYGDRAIELSARRFNRVKALAEMLPSAFTSVGYDYEDDERGYYSQSFFENLESFLFPEKYGYSPEYPEPSSQLPEDERFVLKEEVRWDIQYTKNYFPEILWDIRNSGTLYRDYEEAAPLIFLCARWNDLWKER